MRRFNNFLLAGITFSAVALSVRAADLKLEARLIWGANDDKETVKYQPIAPELADKLHRMFKWKNYYDITNKTASIALNQTNDLKMSDACTIRVKNLGASRVEINCIGHGKPVHKGTYTLVPPQWLVLGGNDSSNTAWFVGLRALDGKTADAKKAISKN
jgi:hypothetical protein